MVKAGRMMKKGEAGEAVRYVTRKRAMKMLQLGLNDFRRLCILKGIYPREPKNRKKAQKGSSELRTLYYKRDIQFLLHEPIIWKMRDKKIFNRRLKKAIGRQDKERMFKVFKTKPFYRLDHVIKERYPTFLDAVRDLDDVMSLLSLISTFPKSARAGTGMINVCRRLTIEFMHYVIETRGLRKVFISIKGYYYQAEVLGQTVTWLVPHNFTVEPPPDVDIRLLGAFSEFYMPLLGFVNFRLYHKLNLHYPPRLATSASGEESEIDPGEDDEDIEDEFGVTRISEQVAALNQPLLRSAEGASVKAIRKEEEEAEAAIDKHLIEETDEERVSELLNEQKRLREQQDLFCGQKFFLGRETNRESLCFIIRACGGEVSWDKCSFSGATYQEDDETITHQITDRPELAKKYLSRYYIQPQWVYDCINSRRLLPVRDYFPGVSLPPHISPFVNERHLDYMPPERQKFLAIERGDIPENQDEEEEDEEEEIEDDEDEEVVVVEKDEEEDELMLPIAPQLDEEEEEETEQQKKLKGMFVSRGTPIRENLIRKEEKSAKEEQRMRLFMMPKKNKYLYHKLRKSEAKRTKFAKGMTYKRKQIDKQMAEEKKFNKIKVRKQQLSEASGSNL